MAFHQVSPHFLKIILEDGRDIRLSVVTAVSQILQGQALGPEVPLTLAEVQSSRFLVVSTYGCTQLMELEVKGQTSLPGP